VSSVRGRGLLCAIDLPSTAVRDDVLVRLRDDERVLLLGSGTRSLRFRPALTIAEEELSAAVGALNRVLIRR
ncbi:MAG: aminotransferase class III-fold pyridoxal phosphate-dependent enzyme, partial [Egibacteraceae bacterium]